MRAESFTARVIAVASRRAPAFQSPQPNTLTHLIAQLLPQTTATGHRPKLDSAPGISAGGMRSAASGRDIAVTVGSGIDLHGADPTSHVNGDDLSHVPQLHLRTAVILLAAAIIGMLAGVLTFLSGAPAEGAILAGLTGFGASAPALHVLIQ